MKNKNIDEIKQIIYEALYNMYGYCGIAESDKIAMLNSGDDDEYCVITIKDLSEN